MPIIIPSKNIYNKKNPKVRNNLLQAIEVNAKTVVPQNQYEVAILRHQESVSIDDIGATLSVKDDDTFVNRTTETSVIYGANYRDLKYWYLDFTFAIPQKIKNGYISKIYDLVEQKEDSILKESEVKISVFGDIKQAQSTAEYFNVGGAHTGNFEYYGFGSYNTVQTNVLFDFNSIEKRFLPEEDLTTVTSNTQSGNYILKCKFWVGAYIEYLFGENGGSPYLRYDIPMSGTATFYDPKRVEITVNGDTIGIDLEDKSIIYGDENSPNIISIDGNELMQTENYLGEDTSISALEWFDTTTLPEYKNGKETATILCSISDYYDHIGKIAISPESNHNIIPFPYINKSATIDGVTFTVNNTSGVIKAKGTAQSTQLGGAVFYLMSNYEFDRPTTLFLSGCPVGGKDRQTYSIQIQTKVMENGVVDDDRWFFDYGKGVKCPNVIYIKMIRLVAFNNYTLPENFEFRPMLVYGAFAQEFQKSLPMTFDVYDEVIPRVLNSNGKDAPMSTYADGSAKVFKVLGVRVRYDGVTMQELILQEK